VVAGFLAIAYLEMDERKVSQYRWSILLLRVGKRNWSVIRWRAARILLFASSLFPCEGASRAPWISGRDDIYIPRELAERLEHIVIQRLNREQNILDLLIADAARAKHEKRSANRIPIGSMSRRPYFQGRQLSLVSERTGYRHLYLYDLDGKLLGQITQGEWEVTSLNAVEESKAWRIHGDGKIPARAASVSRSVDGSGSHASPGRGTHDGVLARTRPFL